MQLAQFSIDGRHSLGLVSDGGIIDLHGHLPATVRTMVDLIEQYVEVLPILRSVERTRPHFSLRQVALRAPVTRPAVIELPSIHEQPIAVE